jgi:hypothetical protein
LRRFGSAWLVANADAIRAQIFQHETSGTFVCSQPIHEQITIKKRTQVEKDVISRIEDAKKALKYNLATPRA